MATAPGKPQGLTAFRVDAALQAQRPGDPRAEIHTEALRFRFTQGRRKHLSKAKTGLILGLYGDPWG